MFINLLLFYFFNNTRISYAHMLGEWLGTCTLLCVLYGLQLMLPYIFNSIFERIKILLNWITKWYKLKPPQECCGGISRNINWKEKRKKDFVYPHASLTFTVQVINFTKFHAAIRPVKKCGPMWSNIYFLARIEVDRWLIVAFLTAKH